MKAVSALVSILLFAASVQAAPFVISLTEFDQGQLTKAMSNIDYRNKTEEVVNADRPNWYVLKNYFLLDSNSAFSVRCSEEFHQASTIGINKKCQVTFDYEKNNDLVSAKDGFIGDFAVGTINDPNAASVLFDALNVARGNSAFFSSKEQVPFTHPVTGQKFGAFRLRMDCTKLSCTISAVK